MLVLQEIVARSPLSARLFPGACVGESGGSLQSAGGNRRLSGCGGVACGSCGLSQADPRTRRGGSGVAGLVVVDVASEGHLIVVVRSRLSSTEV